MKSFSLSHLADHVLLRDLAVLVAEDRHTTAALLAHLAEVDARKLYLPAAYPSMFHYCVGELRLSEDAAFKRIQAARTARKHPAIFAALAAGRLHLSAVVLLAPHLTPETADELLMTAAHKSKAEIELLLAKRFPRPDLPTRLLPLAPGADAVSLAPGQVTTLADAPAPTPLTPPSEPRCAELVAPPAPRARVAPLSPGRFAWHLTVDQETQDLLNYAQSLLGHALPSGDIAKVLNGALKAYVHELEKRRFAAGSQSRPSRKRSAGDKRHIPADVRRSVWQRDQGQCTYVSERGHRCPARTRLEFDHVTPFARGGLATVEGLRLRCRAHNQYAAECAFGAGFMARKRADARRKAARARAPKDNATMHDAAADQEVIPWLRALGFRADEARRGATLSATIAHAPLEERVRLAISSLAPGSPHRAPGISSGPA